jgi:hypothetical protein
MTPWRGRWPRDRSDFSDSRRFPEGSVEFDHALIMRNIAHEWHNTAESYV